MRKKSEIDMKRIALVIWMALGATVWAQSPAPAPPKTPQVDSTWPGVKLEVPEVKRIEDNRLLVVVQVHATSRAPSVTLIGTPPPPPPANPTPDQLLDVHVAIPYSITSATMTDDLSQKKFAPLGPDPHGQIYRPSTLLGSLGPNESIYLTVQFAVPPPPPPDKDGKIPKQTVSILLPNSSGPITGIVIPPETAP